MFKSSFPLKKKSLGKFWYKSWFKHVIHTSRCRILNKKNTQKNLARMGKSVYTGCQNSVKSRRQLQDSILKKYNTAHKE